MYKLSQEEIDKMKEEIKEIKKKIDRLEWFIRINEYNENEHKVYEGGSDLHLHYEGTKERKNIIGVQQTETSDNIEYNKVDSYSKVIGKVKKQNLFDIPEPPFECCKDCPNNFKNNPSSGGICSCDLPYKEMFRW